MSMKSKRAYKLILLCSIFLLLITAASAQFNSGSTGADGALDLSTMTCPSNECFVQLPESGVLNYTTVNVPSDKALKFLKNTRNTPVIMLAQGNVTISGQVKLDASGNIPGPGGFYGGQLGFPGFGPGGGTEPTLSGRWVGPLSLVPIVGGSGGMALHGGCCGHGGGGGGAIVIASSTSIVAGGQFTAHGQGNNGVSVGFGSGGAIRLVANTLVVSAGFNACSFNPASGSIGPCGVVRLEATSLTFTGGSTPPATLSTINPNILSGAQPQLTIQSVGGFQVPPYAGSRFDTIDLLLPNQIPDPVNVVVGANNVPTGTQVQVGFVSGSPNTTSAPCSLSGTLANSSCTATISNLTRTAVTYLLATAAFDPPASLAKHNPTGQNQVAKVKMEAILGGPTKYIFMDRGGKEIDRAKIAKAFLEHFGM